jgi:hypothetical protein
MSFPRATSVFFVLGLGVALGACSAASDDMAFPSAAGSGSAGSGAGAGPGAGGVASGGTSGNGGGLSLDGGAAAGGGSGASTGCQKIDFLFVVDNSESMEDKQAQLVASFPGFISAIESTVGAGSDFHILVTDTDKWGRCNTANPWTGSDPSSSDCNSYVKNTVFDECDRKLGGGVIDPAGLHASNKVCPFPGARRFLAEGDPDVSGAFACAAQVGVAGNAAERPMDAMVAALQTDINGPGGCNEGFLRDDAVLVITFISDDPWYEDSGTPSDWYDAVVQAKHGDPNAAVVVGFTPNFPGCRDGKGPPKGAHWSEFVAKFPFSIEANVCGTDYASTFAQAVSVIGDSCEQYVPPVQ